MQESNPNQQKFVTDLTVSDVSYNDLYEQGRTFMPTAPVYKAPAYKAPMPDVPIVVKSEPKLKPEPHHDNKYNANDVGDAYALRNRLRSNQLPASRIVATIPPPPLPLANSDSKRVSQVIEETKEVSVVIASRRFDRMLYTTCFMSLLAVLLYVFVHLPIVNERTRIEFIERKESELRNILERVDFPSVWRSNVDLIDKEIDIEAQAYIREITCHASMALLDEDDEDNALTVECNKRHLAKTKKFSKRRDSLKIITPDLRKKIPYNLTADETRVWNRVEAHYASIFKDEIKEVKKEANDDMHNKSPIASFESFLYTFNLHARDFTWTQSIVVACTSIAMVLVVLMGPCSILNNICSCRKRSVS